MALEINNLCLEKNGEDHLVDASAQFERGKMNVIIGRTLAGKTTVHRVIAGLQSIDSGSVVLDGRDLGDVPAWKRDVAAVYQQFINYPHLDVFDNVAFPLRRKSADRGAIDREVGHVLELVGLSAMRGRMPSALSGGQQQRVALARALVRDAPVLLLDEPLVNLDYKLREQLREELREIVKRGRQSVIVFNTTDPVEALVLADNLIVMDEGRVLQTGPAAEVFGRPADVEVARIVNDPPMNFIDGEISDLAIDLGSDIILPVPPLLASGCAGRCTIGIRASDLKLTSGEGLPGSVSYVEFSGSETFVHVSCAAGELVVQLEGVHTIRTGEAVRVALDMSQAFGFESSGARRLIATPNPENR